MAKQNNFKQIAEEIYQNRHEHEQKIKELFVKTEICSIDDFYNNYQQEVRDINSEITPSKDRPTIADFKEIFHVFEKYPSNLQKPKKTAPKDLSRTLALSRAASTTELGVGNQSNSVTCSPQMNVWEKGPEVSQIYNGFREFKQSLKKLFDELKEKKLETDYINKLNKLNAFSKDIEKLCGTEGRDITQAFNEQETATLRSLAVNLEKALYINANRNLFHEDDHFNRQTNVQNLENGLELLTYWLNSIGHYQDI